MEDNKLVFYNMGIIESNEIMFRYAIKQEFGIESNDLELVVGGFKFLFDSKTNTYIRVEFMSNGSQLKTSIIGERAEDVMAVYNAFASRFFDESEVEQ
ncbi:hypothetical protein [Clostridium butyricum]|uniref:hypothetical protein n=1 Tax=Clostridium butyricum TaxID=1492 RepID=UPI00290FF5F9|nr:hypothetical protein [Clostridium butyricum]MDU5101415.1 hypothetical protein [Clostridium butyricum]